MASPELASALEPPSKTLFPWAHMYLRILHSSVCLEIFFWKHRSPFPSFPFTEQGHSISIYEVLWQYILSKIYVKEGLFGRDQEMLPERDDIWEEY